MACFHNFEGNFSCLVAGASFCGKTHLLNRLLSNHRNQFSQKFDRIYWCYAEEGSISNKVKGVTYIKGFPSNEILENEGGKPILLILDDLMNELDRRISLLFSRGCHHNQISVFVLIQNLFFQSAVSRDIALNAKYLIIFKVRVLYVDIDLYDFNVFTHYLF